MKSIYEISNMRNTRNNFNIDKYWEKFIFNFCFSNYN